MIQKKTPTLIASIGIIILASALFLSPGHAVESTTADIQIKLSHNDQIKLNLKQAQLAVNALAPTINLSEFGLRGREIGEAISQAIDETKDLPIDTNHISMPLVVWQY